MTDEKLRLARNLTFSRLIAKNTQKTRISEKLGQWFVMRVLQPLPCTSPNTTTVTVRATTHSKGQVNPNSHLVLINVGLSEHLLVLNVVNKRAYATSLYIIDYALYFFEKIIVFSLHTS